MVSQPHSAVLTERFTYTGVSALSSHNTYRLHGVDCDTEGLVPDALDRAFAETGASVVFATPTLQTPTGTTMSMERRKEIADVICSRDAFLVEDDVYAFLFDPAPRPISLLIPERTFYITSFGKCLDPGLRIGAMVVPDAFRDRSINAVRATGWNGIAHHGRNCRAANSQRRSEPSGSIEAGGKPPAVMPSLMKCSATGCPSSRRHRDFTDGFRYRRDGRLSRLSHKRLKAGITLALPGALQQVERGTLGVRLCLVILNPTMSYAGRW